MIRRPLAKICLLDSFGGGGKGVVVGGFGSGRLELGFGRISTLALLNVFERWRDANRERNKLFERYRLPF